MKVRLHSSEPDPCPNPDGFRHVEGHLGWYSWSAGDPTEPGEEDHDPYHVDLDLVAIMAAEPDAIAVGWFDGIGTGRVADVAFPTRERALEALQAAALASRPAPAAGRPAPEGR